MPALGSGDALDRQRRCLGLGGNLFQNQGGPFAGIEQVQIDEGPARQPIFGGETGVGIFRRQARHGHGAFHQAGAGFGRQVRRRHRGLTLADEDPQAQIARFLTLHVFQLAVAHPDRQGPTIGADRLGGVGAGPQGRLDDVIQKIGQKISGNRRI